MNRGHTLILALETCDFSLGFHIKLMFPAVSQTRKRLRSPRKTCLFSSKINTNASTNLQKNDEKPPVRPVSYQEVGFLSSDASRVFSGTANTGKVINLSFR